jgi:hypothetical protein
MSGDSGWQPRQDEYRHLAVTAFLGAGMHDSLTPALAVQALADARRSVAACRARAESVVTWLAGEIKFPGIRENAATLAVLELPQFRDAVAQSYVRRHPERSATLRELLVTLGGETRRPTA